MGHSSISPIYNDPTSQPTELKENATNALVLETTVQLQRSCVPALISAKSDMTGQLDRDLGVWKPGQHPWPLSHIPWSNSEWLFRCGRVHWTAGGTTSIREHCCHEGEALQRFVKRVKPPPCNHIFVWFGPVNSDWVVIWSISELLNRLWSEC